MPNAKSMSPARQPPEKIKPIRRESIKPGSNIRNNSTHIPRQSGKNKIREAIFCAHWGLFFISTLWDFPLASRSLFLIPIKNISPAKPTPAFKRWSRRSMINSLLFFVSALNCGRRSKQSWNHLRQKQNLSNKQ